MAKAENENNNLPAIIAGKTIKNVDDAEEIVILCQTATGLLDAIDESFGKNLKEADAAHKNLKKSIDEQKKPLEEAIKIGKAMLLGYELVDPEFSVKGLSIATKNEIIIPDDDEFLYSLFNMVTKKKLPIGVFTVNAKVMAELHSMGTLKLNGIILDTKEKKTVTIRRG